MIFNELKEKCLSLYLTSYRNTMIHLTNQWSVSSNISTRIVNYRLVKCVGEVFL